MSKKNRIRREKIEVIRNIQASTGRGCYVTPKQLQYIKQEVTAKILEDALARVLLCAATVVDNDYGKLRSRETRLKKFIELAKKYLEHVDNFTEEMQATNEKLQHEVGLEIYDFK